METIRIIDLQEVGTFFMYALIIEYGDSGLWKGIQHRHFVVASRFSLEAGDAHDGRLFGSKTIH